MNKARKIMATILLSQTEIVHTSRSVKMYFPTLRILGVLSSKWPNSILPRAYMMLTTAISNHNDSFNHISMSSDLT